MTNTIDPVEKIGEGGNAEVFLSQETQTINKIKCKATYGEKVDRLTRELEILKYLHSELDPDLNIPTPLSDEIEIEDDFSFFKLMYINGDAQPLDELIEGFKGKTVTPFYPEQARLYFEKLLQIVESFHSAGVIHRDIKPNNILVSLEREELWVIDFGLSCYVGPDDVVTNDGITIEEYSGFKNALIRLEEFKVENVDSSTEATYLYAVLCSVIC